MTRHYQWQGQDLLLFCHLQPGASKTEFSGLHGDRLRIRIKAPPVDGKANAAIIEFLSREFSVAKNQVIIEQGELGRQKTIKIKKPNLIPSESAVTQQS